MEQPAAWTVPIAFAVMVVGSLLTRHRLVPAAVDRVMLRMHLPEEVGTGPAPRPPAVRPPTAGRS
jgi:hypothetical protein